MDVPDIFFDCGRAFFLQQKVLGKRLDLRGCQSVFGHNLLRNQGAKMPSGSQQTAVQSSIKDWSSIPDSYQTAVSVCYALGLLNGQSDGTFGGNNSMNRAQACVVIDRLNQYLTGSNPQQGQNWTRVVNGKEVSYECSLKGTSYRS